MKSPASGSSKVFQLFRSQVLLHIHSACHSHLVSMASEDHSESAAATSPQKLPRLAQPQSGLRTASTSTPLEMASLPSNNTMREAPSSGEKQFTGPAETADPGSNADGRSRTEENPQGSNPELQSAPTIANTTTRITRLKSTAIGPSSDEPIPVPKDVDNTGPTLMITLLLINGARHPFKLDAKYLNRRNVEVQGNDPFNLSIYQLKELILREWREGSSRLTDNISQSELTAGH